MARVIDPRARLAASRIGIRDLVTIDADGGRLEAKLGVALGVEEVGRLQVLGQVFVPDDDRARVDGADELGGAVLLPRGTRVTRGMAFTAVRADGRVLRGEFRNRLGKGYTPVDGFGVVDAQRAVFGR